MAKLTRDDVLKKAEELKNWGKWGPDDELGVLNYVTPEDIVNARRHSPRPTASASPALEFFGVKRCRSRMSW